MRYRDIDAVSRLIHQRIPENSTLEYKSALSLGTQGEKKELLKDLTSMGNGGGGTLIFGMEEEPGTNVAKALTPLADPGLVGVVEDVVTSAVRPPLLWSHETFEVEEGFVVVIDVERSGLPPV
jgi:ATP-dependent DNA helicase RecG